MFYRLNEKLLLRGWEKLPWAVVEKGAHHPLFISAREMQALQLCNGRIDLSLLLVPQEVRELLPMLEERGVIIPCQRGPHRRGGPSRCSMPGIVTAPDGKQNRPPECVGLTAPGALLLAHHVTNRLPPSSASTVSTSPGFTSAAMMRLATRVSTLLCR